MRLEDYERAPDIRGIHGAAAVDKPIVRREWWADQARALGLSWFKLLDDGHSSNFDFAKMLKSRGIMPIVRIFQDAPLPNRLPQYALDTISRYIREGITRWFEIYNEPNLPLEWRPGQWEALAGRRNRTLVEVWLADAEEVIRRGGYPAFPAMAQSGRIPVIGSILWYEGCFTIMANEFRDRARSVFENGGWIATHDAVLNHCYQDESGEWHFECPYDGIEQRDNPGRTIFDGDNSLMGHRVPVTLLKRYFGLEVPIISTEGGVFVPHSGWTQPDPRYPGYDYRGHAERTAAMYRWLERYRVTYPWYFGMCPWLMANRHMGHNAPAWREDGWWHDDRGKLPVVDAVMAMGPPLSDPEPLPPLELPLQFDRNITLAIREDWQDPDSPIVRVVTMPMEEYLKGVVPSVMGPKGPLEAFKAQAVAARSYAYYTKLYPRHAEKNADICNSAHCQTWEPALATEITDQAVGETEDIVSTYASQVINAFYFANCGGQTKNSEDVWRQALPYCRSVPCPVGGEPEGHGVGMCREGAKELARQGKNYDEILKHYYTGIDVEEIVAAPPPPPPPPPPEPHRWRMTVQWRPGPRLIVGTFPRPGIQITATDPWGNRSSSVSGSKPEYGPGGFELLIFHDATYLLQFLGETFEVEVRGDTVHLTFEEVEEVLLRVITQWMEEEEIEELLESLSREPTYQGRFHIEYQER